MMRKLSYIATGVVVVIILLTILLHTLMTPTTLRPSFKIHCDCGNDLKSNMFIEGGGIYDCIKCDAEWVIIPPTGTSTIE